ncbi:MAG: bactofilin family protein [Candidatus Cloacimonadia bacterium]
MPKDSLEKLNTVICKDVKVIGEIHSNGSVRIDGEVDGSIEANGLLTIGPTANVKAEIHAKEAVIAGNVDGKLVIDENLELEKTANVLGDIITKVLTVTTGARFNGKCQMDNSPEKQEIASEGQKQEQEED